MEPPASCRRSGGVTGGGPTLEPAANPGPCEVAHLEPALVGTPQKGTEGQCASKVPVPYSCPCWEAKRWRPATSHTADLQGPQDLRLFQNQPTPKPGRPASSPAPWVLRKK